MNKKILGQPYEFTRQRISIDELRFWPDNPRIYHEVYELYGSREEDVLDSDELHEKLYLQLKKSNDVRELRKSIEHFGGLMEPLIVSKRTNEDVYDVLEGNRRLAACKLVIDSINKESSRTITSSELMDSVSVLECEVAPASLTEEAIFAMLVELHVVGKREWSAFAKASFVRRRFEDLSGDVKKISSEMRMTVKAIKVLVANIELMEKSNEQKTERYSYYDVLNTSLKAKKAMRESPEFTERLVEAAIDWSDKDTALNFRKALNTTFKNDRIAKRFLNGTIELQVAAERAEEDGSANLMYQKIKKFREWLVANKKKVTSFDKSEPEYKKIRFEIRKLSAMSKEMKKKFD